MIRVLLISTSALAIMLPIQAESPATTADVYACATISDDTGRLECYDNAVGRLKAAEDAGEVATVTRAEVEQVKRDSFGFSIPSLPKLALPKLGGRDEDGEISELKESIAKAHTNTYKKVVITLENGQVWQQTDSTRIYISKKRPPEIATIKSAALGSFKMKLDNGRVFRAKRVK